MQANPVALFNETVEGISPIADELRERAVSRHAQLTKPPGSLGVLESVGIDLAAIQQTLQPRVESCCVVVMAADHGHTKSHQVGPYPRDVTAQMVANFVSGGAAINAIATTVGADMKIVDIGVDPHMGAFQSALLTHAPVGPGTAYITTGPAMTKAQLYAAIGQGLAVAEQCKAAGYQAVALGEMGIGNTTIASAMTAVMLDLPASEITGRGTGADDTMLQRKVKVIETAIAENSLNALDGLDILQKIGGFELAGLAGLALGLARHRIAILADGFISTAAVTAATRINPTVSNYLFCGHLSPEPGHRFLLDALQKRPLLNLDLRLGEGTGACLSLTVLKTAANILSDMATFDTAGVDHKTG